MAHEGHPLVGDTLYGGSPREGGLCLHAWRLAVIDTSIEAPPPAWAC
jgi:23S rRNA-/tRNA-specific pseudouridylate synthase